MVIYTICATRINLLFFIIFLSLIVTFSLLAAAYWKIGTGDEVMGNHLTVVSLSFSRFHMNFLIMDDSGCWCLPICGYYDGMVAVDCPAV